MTNLHELNMERFRISTSEFDGQFDFDEGLTYDCLEINTFLYEDRQRQMFSANESDEISDDKD